MPRLALVLLAPLLLSACTGPGSGGQGCGDPSPPICLTLSQNSPEQLYKGDYVLTATAHVLVSADDADIGIVVPAGVQVLSGNPEFRGAVAAGQDVHVQIKVKADHAGDYTFRIWAEDLAQVRPGGRSSTPSRIRSAVLALAHRSRLRASLHCHSRLRPRLKAQARLASGPPSTLPSPRQYVWPSATKA